MFATPKPSICFADPTNNNNTNNTPKAAAEAKGAATKAKRNNPVNSSSCSDDEGNGLCGLWLAAMRTYASLGTYISPAIVTASHKQALRGTSAGRNDIVINFAFMHRASQDLHQAEQKDEWRCGGSFR